MLNVSDHCNVSPFICAMGIFFSVTVVAHYNEFWVKVPGPIISQDGVSPRPPLPHSTVAPLPTTTTTTSPPEPVSVPTSQWPQWNKPKCEMTHSDPNLLHMTPSVYIWGVWPMEIVRARSSRLWSQRWSSVFLPVYGCRGTREAGLSFTASFMI